MTAPVARTCALLLSDLHLQVAHPLTCAAFFGFMRQRARDTDALYLLGDIFEYWAGDDDLDDPFNQSVCAAIRAVSDSGVAVYWIAGNRDFLVGPAFAAAAGLTLLAEPHVTSIGGVRLVLVHGDAECTNDTNYMAFRAMVRQPAWQAQFTARPLAERKAIIAGMRDNSRSAQGAKSYAIMDVTPQAIADVFAATGTSVMIHGHTHRPALHQTGTTRRYVLPDWELDDGAPRGGWIAIDADGVIHRHHLDGSTHQ
jgi:UDP-2,3-diacylglucosamine hydrolase